MAARQIYASTMMAQEVPSQATIAKNKFLQADARYERSESLEKISDYLDRYLDPSELRAPRFQTLIRELKRSIKQFTSDTSALMYAILAVHSALDTVGIKIFSSGFQVPSFNLGTGIESSMKQIEGMRSNLQSAQERLQDLNWDNTLANAYELGSNVIELRIRVLDEFAVKSLGIELADYQKAAVTEARENIAQKVSDMYDEIIEVVTSDEFKQLLAEQGAGAVGDFLPMVGPVYKIGKAAVDLRNKAKELADPYVPRGPIDELFNFIETIEETNEFVRQQIEVLKAQAAYILVMGRPSNSEPN